MQHRPIEELLQEVSLAQDPESTIRDHIRDFLEAIAESPGERWRPGQPLKLFLAGYNGSGNTGADVRVSEMVRQFRTIVGPEQFEPGLLMVKEHLPRDLFPEVAFEFGDLYLPVLLAQKIRAYHGVVTCEGSMFKSSHADLFTMLMASALGFGAAAGKPSVGYGADAGRMNPALESFVAESCRDALVISRSRASGDLLSGLGLRVENGADPAWTFDPAPPAEAEALLRASGWDGATPILGIAPINPFWWPARLDPARAREMEETGAHAEYYFGSGVFHDDSPESQARYARYLDGIAAAVSAYARGRRVFPVLFAMERLDARACGHLAERLEPAPPVFAHRHPREMVALLRLCSLLVSSRFHAIVTAMPGGVASVGLTMDERIRNLFDESGQSERVIQADDPALGDKLLGLLESQADWRAAASEAAERTTAREVRRMGAMGIAFAEELRRHHPELKLAASGGGWQAHLPPLPPLVEAVLARHG
ncbi:Polysaccharide pyruvyl transferase family protein WcaK [Tistlia consotensis]|uniref:Polysaccharide pyruvyl transferase family protein WcaK n=1 Tax=Tistlia consotensis USBA 355 TaxID=560819 RepID=A0A1Y6BH81_9PROT|nr:polysaccharide pyruvyl transferase family protein [Tistlia consotensis]SMF03833.1 Polysaccharide pyruvyl transferase family protein WcaK [Tistlia consotensis USBA 355]SNR54082.1 Polysaccharide pyruvyl transferase family protein WcaK [Tistlia consotensis]